MSVGTNFLYVSIDNVGNGGATPPTGGRIIVRISLSDISAGGTINFGFTNWANAGLAYSSHVTQNTGDEAYWAGNRNNSTMQVFSWKENSGTYFWRDVGVNNWPNGTLTSTGASGADWLTKASSFPNAGVIGATRRNNEVWFAWMASSGTGAPGGFNFPNANIQVVKIDPTNNYSRIDQFAIWNNDYAFAYPALATNDHGEVGIALGWGGKTFDANSAVGILGDFIVWYPEASTFSTMRWGDYVTAHQASPQTGLFAGFAYAILKDSTTTAGYRFDPYYLLFGRNSIINPGGGSGTLVWGSHERSRTGSSRVGNRADPIGQEMRTNASAAGHRAIDAMLPAPFHPRNDDRRHCEHPAFGHNRPFDLAAPLIGIGTEDQFDPIWPEHRCDKDCSKNAARAVSREKRVFGFIDIPSV